MSLLTLLQNRLTHTSQSSGAPIGWVGLDVGRCSIRLAQLSREFGELQFLHRWLFALSSDQFVSDTAIAGGLLASQSANLSGIRKMFAGPTCAATLHPSLMKLRCFDLPAASDAELRDMVREELAADENAGVENCSFDFWRMNSQESELTKIAAVSVPTATAQRVVEDLGRAGFDCRVLDAVPCALARAVMMVQPGNEPTAALDLADDSFTLVVVADQRPVFARVLRGGGLYALLAPLREALKLTHEQCLQLLARCPLSVADENETGKPAVAVQFIQTSLRQLVEEARRTFDFIAQQFSATKPKRLWLTGDGAVIQDLPEYLSGHLPLPVERWRLPSSDPNSLEDARFGVAAALSMLKWEQTSCT